MDIIRKDISYKNKSGNVLTTNMYYVKFGDFKDLQKTIDNELVDIVHASSYYDLTPTKLEIKTTLENKTEKQRNGSIAEFFAHLVVRNLGYIQQCLYRNLEESSMKKGFDGLYLYENLFWLMESKSTMKEMHKDKIFDALSSIKEQIENTSKNNPWMNAVHHISNVENGKRNESIKQKILKLSKDFQENKSHSIDEFNLIPVSTLFLNNYQKIDDIANDIITLLNGCNYKQVIIICIDNYIKDDFIRYLGG